MKRPLAAPYSSMSFEFVHNVTLPTIALGVPLLVVLQPVVEVSVDEVCFVDGWDRRRDGCWPRTKTHRSGCGRDDAHGGTRRKWKKHHDAETKGKGEAG